MRIALAFLGILILLALLVPLLSPYGYAETHLATKNLPPCWEFWFGTDELGRDLFVRIFYGARLSLFIGVVAGLLDLGVGVLWGGLAALLGGRIDSLLMRTADLLTSLPSLLVAILLLVVLGPGIFSLLLALTFTGWIGMARIVRAQLLQLKEQEFIAAAVALGAGRGRILFKHLIPNALPQITATLLLTIPLAIFSETFLSFLGLGIQAPVASWGTMAYEGLPALRYYPWRLLFPSLFTTLLLFTLHVLSEGMRQRERPVWFVRRKGRAFVAHDAPLLVVEELSILFEGRRVVDRVSFTLTSGSVEALVGASGSGKSSVGHALLQLLPASAVIEGKIRFRGCDLLELSSRALCSVRGSEIAMIFQDPLSALNPTMRVGRQIAEALPQGGRHALVEALEHVGLSASHADLYPHQLSGGMRQRVAIAMALAGEPKLLIADEPTTALDPVLQEEILVHLVGICRTRGVALLLITHDLRLVRRFADHAMVLQKGRLVERAPTPELFANPKHPYTQDLVCS